MFSIKRQQNRQFPIKMAMKMSPNQNSGSVDTAILNNFAQVLKSYTLVEKSLISTLESIEVVIIADDNLVLSILLKTQQITVLAEYLTIELLKSIYTAFTVLIFSQLYILMLKCCRCTTGRVCVSPGLFYDGECQVSVGKKGFCQRCTLILTKTQISL